MLSDGYQKRLRITKLKVTSHQIVYCIAYHSVNIMVETRWLRSANSGFLMSGKEVDCLLDAIEEVLPISATQWESVAESHRSRYPNAERTIDSLKRKFKELHSKQILTGEPPLSAFCLLHKAALAIHHQ